MSKKVKVADDGDVFVISRDDWRILQQVRKMRAIGERKRVPIVLQVEVNWSFPSQMRRVIPLG